MDRLAVDRLNKVLALTDSAHDGEALAALRVTRNLLNHNGMNLSHLLQKAVSEDTPAAPQLEFVRVSQDVVVRLQREVISLQKRIAVLQNRLYEQQAEVNYWRNLAEDMQKKAIPGDETAAAVTGFRPAE